MIALLNGVLSGELLNEVAGKKVRDPLSLLHAGGPDSGRDRRLAFLSEAGAEQPFAVVKWGRGAWARGLVREQAAISQVRATSNPVLLDSCPPSWGPFESGPDTVVMIQRYIPSRSIYSQLRGNLWPRLLVDDHFARVSSWLGHFAQATLQAHRPLDEALIEEHIEAPLRTFAQLFGDDFVPRQAIDGITCAAKEHLGQSVPLIAKHGDLWPTNLLSPYSRAGGLYVVDWEHYRQVSLGGFDMLFFCTTYSRDFPWRPMGWMEYEVALSRAFIQRTWLAGHVELALTDYHAAIELPRGLAPILLAVLMARMSVRHVEAMPGRTPDPQAYWPRVFHAWRCRPSNSWLDVWAG